MNARKTFRIAGFSLIEVLVSVAVMSFGLLSLAALQGNLFKSGAESRAQSIALAMASEKIEYFEGYRDRSEFQGFTDGTDAAVTVDGIAFTRSWTIQRYAYPEPEIWPFVAALSVTIWLVWSVWSVPGFAWGLIPPALAFLLWYWPNKKEAKEELLWEREP